VPTTWAIALEKIWRYSVAIRSARLYWHGGDHIAHIPRSDAAPAVSTCCFINVVSLLDEAFEYDLAANPPAPTSAKPGVAFENCSVVALYRTPLRFTAYATCEISMLTSLTCMVTGPNSTRFR
jgi:hypothetical protein